MKITNIKAREIYNCRGIPTVECQVFLDKFYSVIASVPRGTSTGIHESHELQDGGTRLSGRGVLKSCEIIDTLITPNLIGKRPEIISIDNFLIELDGTPNKSKLGANTLLAVSLAVAKAQAFDQRLELFEYIAHLYDAESVTLPYPLFNVINGGMHAKNNLHIQEIMVMPLSGQSFRESLEMGVVLFDQLQNRVAKKNKELFFGIEGGISSGFSSEIEALDLLSEVIETLGGPEHYRIALDVAASHFYDTKTGCYEWHGNFMTSGELIDLYQKLVETYPIYSIEDGLAQDDWQGWSAMTKSLGASVQIVGDDIFVTSVQRIKHGESLNAANAVIVKPNQVGTVTETLYALQACHELDMNPIISHRSGDTQDTFIADLAVGTSAGQIKAGGLIGSEHLAKYNRLLQIEDLLFSGILIDL